MPWSMHPLDEFQRTNGTSLDPWWAVRFEKNGVNVLHQQRLEVVEEGVITMGCHQEQGVAVGL